LTRNEEGNVKTLKRYGDYFPSDQEVNQGMQTSPREVGTLRRRAPTPSIVPSISSFDHRTANKTTPTPPVDKQRSNHSYCQRLYPLLDGLCMAPLKGLDLCSRSLSNVFDHHGPTYVLLDTAQKEIGVIHRTRRRSYIPHSIIGKV